MRARIHIAFVVLSLSGTGSPSAAPSVAPPDTKPARLAVVVGYQDGRSTVNQIVDRFAMWTPGFPRDSNADQLGPPGQPLKALDLVGTRDGEGMILTVSLLYGGVTAVDRVEVTRARVSLNQTITIAQLSAYGVAPITVGLKPIAPVAVSMPAAASVSGQLEVWVEPGARNTPEYVVMIVNHGHVAVRALQFRAFQGEKQAISGRKKHERDEPLIAPGDTFRFTSRLSAGLPSTAGDPLQWHGWDRAEVQAVLWDDGMIEGDHSLLASERALYEQKIGQLEHVLRWFDEASRLSVTDARSRFESMKRAEDIQIVRSALLADLTAYERSHAVSDDRAFHSWVAARRPVYAQWGHRLQDVLTR